MNATQSLVQLRPQSFRRWRALPIFGPHLDDFVQWLGDQGYTPGSIRFYLRLLPQVVRWLRRKRITSLAQLTQQDLQAAYRYYRPRSLDLSGAVRALGRFYVERGTIPEGPGTLTLARGDQAGSICRVPTREPRASSGYRLGPYPTALSLFAFPEGRSGSGLSPPARTRPH